ncbi:MAG TPA: glycosyltransferase family 2 protein [Prosthecobacter sp.]|jgi:glycosyltransferase involved in cell wall biosynthesis|nr:glycosyltransferase family 2 protein [Prosthecobacter sp.]
MNKDCTISINLPTRNRLDTIKLTVEKIKNQTFQDWELIISDNASDDVHKLEYLDQLAAGDPRIKVFKHPENLGILANWMFAIEQCNGRYYVAVADDDYWQEDKFLEALLAMHDGGTGVVFPNLSKNLPESGQFLDKVVTHLYPKEPSKYELCETLINDRKCVVMLGLFDLNVIPKSELLSVYDHGRCGHCENVGMLRLARKYKAKFCPEVSYVHTDYSKNYSRGCDREFAVRDTAIAIFQILDEFRLASKGDPGFNKAFLDQWKFAIHYCKSIASTFAMENGSVVIKEQKNGVWKRFRKAVGLK